MTEAEWMTSDDPIAMHDVVAEGAFKFGWPDGPRTARKRLLFCLACCPLVWPLIEADERCRNWVEWTDRNLEGSANKEEEEELVLGAKIAAEHPDDDTPHNQMMAANLVYDLGDPHPWIFHLVRTFDDWGDVKQRTRDVAALLRCIAGNPFRPITFDPTWRSETVVSLASAIYAERAFDRMPILADALEDAGCDHADILSHCRRSGPHARGCWVVDGVLGKA